MNKVERDWKKIASDLLSGEKGRIRLILNEEKTSIELSGKIDGEKIEIFPEGNGEIRIKCGEGEKTISRNKFLSEISGELKNIENRGTSLKTSEIQEKDMVTMPLLLRRKIRNNNSDMRKKGKIEL